MTRVFLGLGTNIDRERSMSAGLEALRALDPEIIASQLYESEAVGFEGAPFYNCVVQLNIELPLADLVAQLKTIEDANGRDRAAYSTDSKGLDIDVLTYGDWVGEFDGVVLPREDITCYAHVLLPLVNIAPEACLPGTASSFQALWEAFDQRSQPLHVVAEPPGLLR